MSSDPQAEPAPPPTADLAGVDWLSLCRRSVQAQRELFDEVRGIKRRTDYDGIGVGGDNTLVIDRQAEDAVFAELKTQADGGAAFVAISEERGEVTFGGGSDVRVVIDPIDGSLNARRMIPSHSLSVAVADGTSMADVRFGYVYDFGADEEFIAVAGEGSTLGDDRIAVAPATERLELVGLEAARPEMVLPVVTAMQHVVYRLRSIGSIAITAAYVGAGRLDGMVSLRSCRSVDAAAAQLIVREAGGEVTFGDGELSDASLGLEARYPIAAASTPRGLEILRTAQRANPRL